MDVVTDDDGTVVGTLVGISYKNKTWVGLNIHGLVSHFKMCRKS